MPAMIHHALEMEVHEDDDDDDDDDDEEASSLLREVMNGENSNTLSSSSSTSKAMSYRNQINGSSNHNNTTTTIATSSSSPNNKSYTNMMKRISILICTAILVLFVLQTYTKKSSSSSSHHEKDGSTTTSSSNSGGGGGEPSLLVDIDDGATTIIKKTKHPVNTGSTSSSSSSNSDNNEKNDEGTTTTHTDDNDTNHSDDNSNSNEELTTGSEETTANEESIDSSTTPSTSSSSSSSTPTTTTVQQQQEQERNHLYSQVSTIKPDLYRSTTIDTLPNKEEIQQAQIQQYGKWKFWDGDEMNRPTNEYCSGYTHCDIPSTEFPDTSWQVDAVFVNHIIDSAEQLISRSMEAIYSEYGHSKSSSTFTSEQYQIRNQMFHWEKLSNFDAKKPPEAYTKHGNRGNGGYTTQQSYDGLVRRLLHAIMTNDHFTVVLGGHSAAAGHGNHFHQSYAMQFHHIMSPIFARLGVTLVTRNLSQGGLGTLHNSIGAGSLYGNEIDLLLWDSGMTENNLAHIDLFIRQGMIGGNRVPIVWGGNYEVFQALYDHADADLGEFGTGLDGIPTITTENMNDIEHSIPYAARYMKCDNDVMDVCTRQPRFCATCWLPRDDIPDPKKVFDKIDDKPASQVKWHPGWRHHQLVGRVLAFSVLDALQVAIQIFSDGTMGGPPLDDDFWHVTDYYKNIKEKIMNLDPSIGKCHEISKDLPARICNTPMQARSMYTPRANPSETSLTTLIQPYGKDGYIPKNMAQQIYTGPDTHNKCDDLPKDAVDVYAIVSARRRRRRSRNLQNRTSTSPRSTQKKQYEPISRHRPTNTDVTSQYAFDHNSVTTTTSKRIVHQQHMHATTIDTNTTTTTTQYHRALESDADDTLIKPGRGWEVFDEPPGQCDGEYHSYCKRHKEQTCPAIGHHDARGMILGNEYSGWLVMNVPNVKAGIIVMKIVTERLTPEHSTITVGWDTVNNEPAGERILSYSNYTTMEQQHILRRLKKEEYKPIDHLPESFVFDYAIDGKITSLNRDQLKHRIKTPQRVLEFLTLLDDPDFTLVEKTVQVAFRMRGCGRSCVIGISHLYWA